jgi:hypothetical protein
MFVREAEDRGERLDPVEIATGNVTGHSLADVLESARMASERQDAEAERQERRKRGERLQFTGLLEDPATRSAPAMTATRRAIEKGSERFAAAVTARREAERRRGELERVMPQLAPPHWSAGRNRHTSSRAQGSRASLGTDYFGRPISRQRWSYR